MKFTLNKFVLCFALISSFASFTFAQTEREQGIELFKQGKNQEAVAALERASRQTKTDAEVWNYLGLAYMKDEAYKKATKAFEKAASINAQNATYHTNLAYAYFLNNKLDKAQSASTKAIELNPQNSTAYYIRGAASIWKGDNDKAIADAGKAIAINPDYALAYTLKSDALHSAFGRRVSEGAKAIDAVDLLQQAKDVLEICLKNCQNNLQKEIQQEKLETMQVFYNHFSKNRDANLSQADFAPTLPDPSVTPLKILSKKPPGYTNQARQNGIRGTIRMAVLFSESGRVTHMLILKGLGGGLNDAAVNAARQIKFEPARKDGKPISRIAIVEYTFDIR